MQMILSDRIFYTNRNEEEEFKKKNYWNQPVTSGRGRVVGGF